MSHNEEYSFPLIIIAIILGQTIFKQFDFENFRFRAPVWLSLNTDFFNDGLLFIKKFKKNSNNYQIRDGSLILSVPPLQTCYIF